VLGYVAVAVLLALIATPSARAADAPILAWSVSDRLQGPTSIDERAPVIPMLVRIDVDGVCPRDPVVEVDGGEVAERAASGCGFSLPALSAGKHDLTVTSGEHRTSIELDLRDLLVVSIGDSVASGEGTPDAAGPTWLEKRCHRSLRSGAAQAARAVELGDRRSVITLVPLGCSGATIGKGLLGAYDGIDPDAALGALEPQLDVVDGLKRPIDALLLSVGANDVNFGDLVRFCIAVEDCPSRRFDPDHPAREADESRPTLAEVERQALTRLRSNYDALAERLAGALDPDRVIIVEYFDALRDALGGTCVRALPRIDRDEAAWAQRNVLAPLNAVVHAAAERHGWRLVGGVAEAFRRHGICAGRASWIRRPEGSAVRELSLVGSLHPNSAGHIATATLIAPTLAATLGVGPGNEQLASSHEGYVRWPWLLVAAVVGAGLGLALRMVVRA